MMKTMTAMAVLAVMVGGCSGQSPTSPTSSDSTPVVNPLVTIQMSYNCHPCNDDSDNYAINIDCGDRGCLANVHPANWLLEHNTISWTGQLAPGKHFVEVVVRRVEKAMTLAFTGGVKPDSLRLLDSSTADIDILTMSRCGLVNKFKRRPGDYGLESAFEFEVVADGSVC